MRSAFAFAAAAVASMVGLGAAMPLEARKTQQVLSNMEVSKYTTLNGTRATAAMKQSVHAAGTPLSFSLINNLAEATTLNAYISGLDVNNAPVLLSTSGSWYYPDPAGSTEPVLIPADSNLALAITTGANATTQITIPDYLSSGRLYLAEGELTFSVIQNADGTIGLVEPSPSADADPSRNVNWGFMELTNTADGGIYANVSYVDFVGLVVSMRLTLGDGTTQQVESLALDDPVGEVCAAMQEQAAADGQAWDKMCLYDTEDESRLVRVISPNLYVRLNPGSFDEYWATYIDDVWTKYASEDLTVDSPDIGGAHACRVADDVLSCEGDDGATIARPDPTAIFGCSDGAFANAGTDFHKVIVRSVCSAFHRSTLLLDGGNVQPSLPSTEYYTTDPTTHYSRIIHSLETDGLGYSFAYDDVNPADENAAGVVTGMDPQLLEVFIGGTLF